jgi:hypothetical protein
MPIARGSQWLVLCALALGAMLVAAKSVAGDATATLPLGAYRPRVLVEQHLPGGGSLPFRAHAETLLRATGVGTDRGARRCRRAG